VSTNPHTLFLDFLSHEPRVPDAQLVQTLFQHLNGCDDCAKALAEHQSHAEVLLDAARPAPQAAIVAPEVESDQVELLVFGDAVLNRLTLTMSEKAAIEAPLTADAKNELWTLAAVTTPRLRAALACSEGALALSAFLSTGRRKKVVAQLSRKRLLLDNKQVIPDRYFALRLADYASMPEDVALSFWHTFVDLMIDGKIGCLGLFATHVSAEEIRLSLVDD
jgi:hypothetical protein